MPHKALARDHVLEALRRSSIWLVATRHEQAAAFMAAFLRCLLLRMLAIS
jgi:hypothetical protein